VALYRAGRGITGGCPAYLRSQATVPIKASGQLLDTHGIDVSVHMAGSSTALYAGGLVGYSAATTATVR
jgi:hypothetical protein